MEKREKFIKYLKDNNIFEEVLAKTSRVKIAYDDSCIHKNTYSAILDGKLRGEVVPEIEYITPFDVIIKYNGEDINWKFHDIYDHTEKPLHQGDKFIDDVKDETEFRHYFSEKLRKAIMKDYDITEEDLINDKIEDDYNRLITGLLEKEEKDVNRINNLMDKMQGYDFTNEKYILASIREQKLKTITDLGIAAALQNKVIDSRPTYMNNNEINK